MGTYQSYRDKIKDADLLLWRGHGTVARAIQLFGQYHNHASLIFEFYKFDTRRIMLFEALFNGVEPEFLSARLDRYSGRCWWYPLKNRFNDHRGAIYQAANNYGGTPYDYKNLFKNAFGYVSADAEKFLCSEYPYICGVDAGLPPSFGLLAPRPDDLLTLGWWVDEGIELT